MALFKKETHDHHHTHISKEAAKEIRKGEEAMAEAQEAQAKAMRAQADAQVAQAQAELKAVQEQEYTKRYAVDQDKRSEAIKELKELADQGTFDAYFKLTAYRNVEEDQKGVFSVSYKLSEKSGPGASEKDIVAILKGFNYTKDINEFRKIVRYAIQKSYMDDLRLFFDIAEMNSHDPEYASLAKDIDRVIHPTMGNIFSEIKKSYSDLFKVFSFKKK